MIWHSSGIWTLKEQFLCEHGQSSYHSKPDAQLHSQTAIPHYQGIKQGIMTVWYRVGPYFGIHLDQGDPTHSLWATRGQRGLFWVAFGSYSEEKELWGMSKSPCLFKQPNASAVPSFISPPQLATSTFHMFWKFTGSCQVFLTKMYFIIIIHKHSDFCTPMKSSEYIETIILFSGS